MSVEVRGLVGGGDVLLGHARRGNSDRGERGGEEGAEHLQWRRRQSEKGAGEKAGRAGKIGGIVLVYIGQARPGYGGAQ
jgi:hypothetical protein